MLIIGCGFGTFEFALFDELFAFGTDTFKENRSGFIVRVLRHQFASDSKIEYLLFELFRIHYSSILANRVC
ncbi:MAG: hypothetical protein II629_02195, partial [Ruminococcus sp.]|nr:hypothetical protein [Ruminococcus sp.]